MEFASDNTAGVHPAIMAALAQANEGPAPSYGADPWSARAAQALRDVFETEARVFLVATGTAANALALSALTPAYGTVFCHRDSHLNTDECGAPEFFTGGAKLTTLEGFGGKLSVDEIERSRRDFKRGFHQQMPAAVSITQASELGLVYTAEEVGEIGAYCRAHGLTLHMDGARFANALAASNASPAELTWKAGVDVMSFGATKNGAMGVEAVVIFDPALADHFDYRVKRGAHVISKGRFLGAQMAAYLEDGLWLETARHANAMAARLAAGLAGVPGVALPLPTQANEVFAILPRPLHDALQAAGAHYYEWPRLASGLAPIEADRAFVRLVCSFRTESAEVDRLVASAHAAQV
ncbi:threonine aldolase family protein [Roseixanthobacter glucoisosaccharinicivorans]|uniref:threonine aldolase family protein n=1 Tax=Roseixanthobacter glucoisosaccharinicivorans TaxID=3119923 RepID=UPI00372ABEE6